MYINTGKMSTWVCTDCTYKNLPTTAFCDMCTAARPTSIACDANCLSNCLKKEENPEVLSVGGQPTDKSDQTDFTSEARKGEAVKHAPAAPLPVSVEEGDGCNPFSVFMFRDDDEGKSASIPALPPRTSILASSLSLKRPLSKTAVGQGCGGTSAHSVHEKGRGKKKEKATKQSKSHHRPPTGCSGVASKDFENESEDQKEATILKWRRILGPLSTQTEGGGGHREEGEARGRGAEECGKESEGAAWGGERGAARYHRREGGVATGGAKDLTGSVAEAVGEASESEAGMGPGSTLLGADAANLQRFRLLVAVILSSRTQEQIVRQAMETISREYPGPRFSPDSFAALPSSEALSEKLSFVHCNKVKSKHILQSAATIQTEFGGRVPGRREGLLRMAGIGPTLAPLLEFLFTRLDEGDKAVGNWVWKAKKAGWDGEERGNSNDVVDRKGDEEAKDGGSRRSDRIGAAGGRAMSDEEANVEQQGTRGREGQWELRELELHGYVSGREHGRSQRVADVVVIED